MPREVDTQSNMATVGCSNCSGVYVVGSLVLYIAQLVTNGMYAHALYQTEGVKTWFLPYIGLLLLPMVTVQLISAILLLTKSGDKMSSSSSISTAILHMFQLGFIWRHLSLFRERMEVNKARDIGDLKLLQTFHTVASMLPLLLVQSVLFFHYNIRDTLIIITMALTLIGCCWHAAVLCENNSDSDDYKSESFGFQCPGSVFLLVWRFGELVSRMLSLAVFTSMYSYWIFLVVSLHALTMFVCLMSSVLGINETEGATRTRKVLTNMQVAYVYTFFFTNSSSDASNTPAFRYIFYYVVMFLENLVLTAVWYLRIDQSNHFEAQTIALTSAVAFFAAIVSMAIYFRWCSDADVIDSEKVQLFSPEQECINCRLSICSKHNIKRQRPFSAGWMSQYQTAVTNGQYYKNVLQDTMLDSEWDSVPDCLNSSGEHWQIRDTDLDSMRTNDKKPPVTGIQGAGTYSHKRFFDTNHSMTDIGDTDSITSGSGVYDEDWRQKSDALLSQLSAHDTLSLLSSRTQLLTDNWDNLTQSDGHLCRDPKHPKQIDILNSLIRKDHDSSFFSDGYMTDNTLISYQLPVTVLSKKRARNIGRRGRAEPAFSTASDSTDCTICAFMRQNPSSPEMSGRDNRSRLHDRLPESNVKRETRKKRRQLKLSNGRRSRPNAKSLDRAGVCDIDSELDRRRRVLSADRLNVPPRHVISSNSSFESDYNSRHPQIDALYAQPNKYAKRTRKQPPTIKMDVLCKSDLPSKPPQVPIKEKCSNLHSNHRDIDKLFRRKASLTNASDSGDSAFPRSTPLSSYLVATDDDQDGQSVSSCEMII